MVFIFIDRLLVCPDFIIQLMRVGIRQILSLVVVLKLGAMVADFEYIENQVNIHTKSEVKEDYSKILKDCFEKLGTFSKLTDHDAKRNAYFLYGNKTLIPHIVNIFKALKLFTKEENVYATIGFFSYQIVPYHNICHAITVGSLSANIYFKKAHTQTESVNYEEQTPFFFLYGFFHDIGHPGYTDTYLARHKTKEQSLSLFELQENADKTKKICVLRNKSNSVVIHNFYGMYKKLIKNQLSMNKVEEINFLNYNKKTNKSDIVAFNDGAEKFKNSLLSVTRVLKDVYSESRKSESELLDIFCESAELTHAVLTDILMSFFYKNNASLQTNYIAAILGTNMKAAIGKIHLNSAYNDLKIIHVSDVIGGAVSNEEFSNEMKKQLFFEFAYEAKQGIFLEYLGIKLDTEKQPQIDKLEFLKGQIFFCNTILGEISNAGLNDHQLFKGTNSYIQNIKENIKNLYIYKVELQIKSFSDFVRLSDLNEDQKKLFSDLNNELGQDKTLIENNINVVKPIIEGAELAQRQKKEDLFVLI